MWDAEGKREKTPCPNCQSKKTITYHYAEGFTELECEACGFQSDSEELSALGRYRNELKEGKAQPIIPMRKLKA